MVAAYEGLSDRMQQFVSGLEAVRGGVVLEDVVVPVADPQREMAARTPNHSSFRAQQHDHCERHERCGDDWHQPAPIFCRRHVPKELQGLHDQQEF